MVGVAVKVIAVPWHTPFWSARMLTVGVTFDEVIFIGALVAVVGFAQASLLVMTTVTTSPSASVDELYVSLFVPTFAPFTCHWYEGVVPPFTGIAVNVRLPPAQIDVVGALMLTDGACVVMFIVTGRLVAVGVVRQLALLVMMTVTTSPFASVDEL